MRTKTLFVIPFMGLALAGCSHASQSHLHRAVPTKNAALKKELRKDEMRSTQWFMAHPVLLHKAFAYCNTLNHAVGRYGYVCSTVVVARDDAKGIKHPHA